MGLDGIQEDEGGSIAESAAGAWWPGAQQKIGEAFTQLELYAKYQERKANVKRLHIKTSLPIPIDEQLMFEAVDGSTRHRGGSSSSMSSVPSVSSAADHEAFIEREREREREREEVVGYMQVQMDSVPTLFPPFSPLDDDTTSQPPTGPPFSSPSPPSPPPVSTWTL
ncbi:hypothetical protein M9H77_18524 [Catharanthus roseus]|uniref:Uncharacterized protein n=1 Tax=Catharanthus roseus TaxID=4058 RepID=A0ACC0B7Q0_CATRO|nr:hypothetical protein M9H77_18524 [Catharanthus roseus]